MLAGARRSIPWYRTVLIAAGLVSFVRGVIALYDPDYWSPRTALDYAAVTGTSLTFLLLAVGLWGFYQWHVVPSGRARGIWRIAILVVCISAVTLGINNFLEDMFGVRALGMVWVVGILTLTLGMLAAGISAFWVRGFSPLVGALFLAGTAGLLFVGSFGFFVLGIVLLLFGGWIH